MLGVFLINFRIGSNFSSSQTSVRKKVAPYFTFLNKSPNKCQIPVRYHFQKWLLKEGLSCNL